MSRYLEVGFEGKDNQKSVCAMRYCLWRILGNDLPPRHTAGQTEENLRFILDHESMFPDCEKRFLLNRIVDKEVVNRLERMLYEMGWGCESIPFDRYGFDLLQTRKEKVAYLTNVNTARNHCVERGLQLAEYSLPFDGACFFKDNGWESFDTVVRANPWGAYWIVPMWRLENRADALDRTVVPRVREEYHYPNGRTVLGLTEPQIVFGPDSDARFDESLIYGACDKAELLWRLRFPGVWDRWHPDLQQRSPVSKFAGQAKCAGFVCRLPSGESLTDVHNVRRSAAREEGLKRLLALAER